MDEVATMSAEQRRELFLESANQRGMNPAIMEKDFWVCWVLKHLFAHEEIGPHMVFKGGTSLSKVFGLIERFSEDIDLILDWRLIGYGDNGIDVHQDFTSNARRNAFNQEVNKKAANYIQVQLIPQLQQALAGCAAVQVAIQPNDPHTITVAYPRAFEERYIRPEVCLEIGPLASWVPSSVEAIRPYSAEIFPDVFDHPSCRVTATTAERTFWEKATILHQQAHRQGPMPPRYSRHYYDMHCLFKSSVGTSSLAQATLLSEVIEFKKRFYPSGWANYDEAQPGTLKLLPQESHRQDLARDYKNMEVMIFGEVPSFDEIIESLQQLENQINE